MCFLLHDYKNKRERGDNLLSLISYEEANLLSIYTIDKDIFSYLRTKLLKGEISDSAARVWRVQFPWTKHLYVSGTWLAIGILCQWQNIAMDIDSSQSKTGSLRRWV